MFRIVFKDYDKQEFNYSDPTNHDDDVNHRTEELMKKEKRNIQIHTTEATVDEIMSAMEEYGLKYNPELKW